MKVFFITIGDVIKYDISRIKRIMPKCFDRADAYKQEKDRLLCLAGATLLQSVRLSDTVKLSGMLPRLAIKTALSVSVLRNPSEIFVWIRQ